MLQQDRENRRMVEQLASLSSQQGREPTLQTLRDLQEVMETRDLFAGKRERIHTGALLETLKLAVARVERQAPDLP